MWRLALLFVLALSVRAQDDDADRLLTSVRQPVIVEANLPNITVGFKTGPNIPGTQFTIKCVLEGDGCDATPQGQSVRGSLPVKPAAVEGTVQGLEVDQTYSCYVETTLSENGKVSYCQEAMPFPGVVRFELRFGAYSNASAFGPSEQAQVCANVLSLQPGGTCSVLRVTDGSAIVLIQVEYDDFRNTWSLTETLTQNATAVTAALTSGLEGSVEIADVETEPPVPNPLSPTNVAANAASDCSPSVVVTWAAPQRSSTITGYFVSCTSLTAPAVNGTVAATQRNTTLSIQAGEEYTCSVASQGPSGASEPAAASSPVTYSYPSECQPPAPTDVATDLFKSTGTSWAVTWTNGGKSKPEQTFTVQCGENVQCNSTDVISVADIPYGTSEAVLSGLSAGVSYTCFVVAVNDAGRTCSSPVEYQTESCDCPTTTDANTFANFTLGNINGQSGWTMQDSFGNCVGNCPYDQAITEYNGVNVWRVSNAQGTFGFSDVSTSPGVGPAGETGASLWNNYGTDNTKPFDPPQFGASATSSCFCSAMKFRSVTEAAQPGFSIEYTPAAKQSTWRMSFVEINDNGVDGFDLKIQDRVNVSKNAAVNDCTGKPNNCPFGSGSNTTIVPSSATGFGYDTDNVLAVSIEFRPGIIETSDAGDTLYTGNDLVKIYANGNLIFVGTTWEAYYYALRPVVSPPWPADPDPKKQALNSIMFRAEKPSVPDLEGEGIYITSFEQSAPN
eukprot:CAMPEP_0118797774 /NCGR_PEP_ID=MMETSP1161-20130426/263_1 /TAXON_ID=249345 /ORGANISM="Picochlorum oklahomensis, Strain CCMP2329" /LENGTH=729 /DNA_ID=CAMNT_0006724991 /DNA_START=93 /DNA_END=2282 /DNA_ORIENTATION=+